jgi:hypothetical protein
MFITLYNSLLLFLKLFYNWTPPRKVTDLISSWGAILESRTPSLLKSDTRPTASEILRAGISAFLTLPLARLSA